MTLPPILTFSFWFSLTPAPFVPFMEKGFFIFFLACLLVGIILHWWRRGGRYEKPMRKALGDVANDFLVTSFFGLLLFWFTEERIMVLGMRMWFLVLLAWMIFRGIANYRRMFIEIPEAMEEKESQRRFFKWMQK